MEEVPERSSLERKGTKKRTGRDGKMKEKERKREGGKEGKMKEKEGRMFYFHLCLLRLEIMLPEYENILVLSDFKYVFLPQN